VETAGKGNLHIFNTIECYSLAAVSTTCPLFLLCGACRVRYMTHCKIRALDRPTSDYSFISSLLKINFSRPIHLRTCPRNVDLVRGHPPVKSLPLHTHTDTCVLEAQTSVHEHVFSATTSTKENFKFFLLRHSFCLSTYFSAFLQAVYQQGKRHGR
jgi:hypothetical protein